MACASLKLVLMGDSAVGKTSLVKIYNGDLSSLIHVPSKLTISTSYVVIENKLVMQSVYDTAGTETLDDLRRLSYSGTDIFVIVFSLADKSSLDRVWTRWVPEVAPLGRPWVLIGTKADSRVMSPVDVKEKISSLGAHGYFETSIFSRETVQFALEEIAHIAHAVQEEEKKAQNKTPRCCPIL